MTAPGDLQPFFPAERERQLYAELPVVHWLIFAA
jgi:hypothetical protein